MQNIEYTLIPSARKTIAIQITPEGKILVRCPHRMPKTAIDAFVRDKARWIQTHLQRISAQPQPESFTSAQIQAFSAQTKALLDEKLPALAQQMGVQYNRVTVRKQRTRWGSCSSKGNLNFNCLLALVPEEVFVYIMVHELCHLKEMNHSRKFWAKVEQVLPEYKAAKAWLKSHGHSLIRRL